MGPLSCCMLSLHCITLLWLLVLSKIGDRSAFWEAGLLFIFKRQNTNTRLKSNIWQFQFEFKNKNISIYLQTVFLMSTLV